ncbi:unnamed protein product [Amoebophrya sp. A120]|nr:unnamed protein product [Amoebophrya sp. A120]|eukprot:GSA120T00010595001.1
MPKIALTREDGLNDQLEQAVRAHYMKHVSVFDDHISYEELPGVEQIKGPDFQRLARLWDKEEFDCCCLLGTEAAKIYVDQCKHFDYAKLVCVGKGTLEVLQKERRSSNVVTLPDKATADGTGLADHLPLAVGTRLLLLCSVQQKDECKSTLEQRGFETTVFQVYSTQPRTEPPTTFDFSKVDIWTFGSASAVKGVAQWKTANVKVAICVNLTTAKTAQQLLPAKLEDGSELKIECADKSGVKSWAAKVVDFLKNGPSKEQKDFAAEKDKEAADHHLPAKSSGAATSKASATTPNKEKKDVLLAGTSSSSSSRPGTAGARGSPGTKRGQYEDPLAAFLASTGSGSSASKSKAASAEKKVDPLGNLTFGGESASAKKKLVSADHGAAATGAGVAEAKPATTSTSTPGAGNKATAALESGAPEITSAAAKIQDSTTVGLSTAGGEDISSKKPSLGAEKQAIPEKPPEQSVAGQLAQSSGAAASSSQQFSFFFPTGPKAAAPVAAVPEQIVEEAIVDDRSRASTKEPAVEGGRGGIAGGTTPAKAKSKAKAPGTAASSSTAAGRAVASSSSRPASASTRPSSSSASNHARNLQTANKQAGAAKAKAASTTPPAYKMISSETSRTANVKDKSIADLAAGKNKAATTSSSTSAKASRPLTPASGKGARTRAAPSATAASGSTGAGKASSSATSTGTRSAAGAGGSGADLGGAQQHHAGAGGPGHSGPTWQEVNQLWEVIGKWESSFSDLKKLHETEVGDLKKQLQLALSGDGDFLGRNMNGDELGSPSRVDRGGRLLEKSGAAFGASVLDQKADDVLVSSSFATLDAAKDEYQKLRREYEEFRKAKFVEIELLHNKLATGGGGVGGIAGTSATTSLIPTQHAAEVAQLRAENAQLVKQVEYFTLYATV